MSFLAPWALAIGGVAAAGMVLLHLVASQRPAAFLLPTARFIPDRRTLVRRIASRPRDLLLLALRLLLLLSAAAAFARPVAAPRAGARARLMLLDRSSAVADPSAALAEVRRTIADGVPTRVVAFDSAATLLGVTGAALDSIARVRPAAGVGAGVGAGSVGAALAAARRAAGELARGADSVELVLVSPVVEAELDAATDSVRAQWPGALRLLRVGARTDSSGGGSVERALRGDDPLAPALARAPVGASPRAVRLRYDPLTGTDSAYARAGGAVVRWDTLPAAALTTTALVAGDDLVVATLRRGWPEARGTAIVRWPDGSAAATELRLGDGCLRRVAVGVPAAGDLPLRPSFQRLARGLLGPCSHTIASPRASDARVARLAGAGAAARGADLASADAVEAPLVPWLLGLALAAALAELVVRAWGRRTREIEA